MAPSMESAGMSYLVTTDDLDFVSGVAWHDGLTDLPQQREEARRIQQHKPAAK